MKALQWSDASDRALLLAIIADGVTSIRWDNIATKMQNKGYNVSNRACNQRYYKIRKESNNATPNGNSDGRARTQKKPAAKSGAKRKVADEDAGDNSDDEEEWGGGSPSPAKRSKKEEIKEEIHDDEGFASQSASSFKVEDLNEFGNVKGRQVIDLEHDDLYDTDA